MMESLGAQIPVAFHRDFQIQLQLLLLTPRH